MLLPSSPESTCSQAKQEALNPASGALVNRVYLSSLPALQRYLTQTTRCPDMAADLIQELYLRLPSLQPVPDNEATIKSWLFKVASNLAVDHFRTEKRHAELINENLTLSDAIASVPTPEVIAEHTDQLQCLHTALAALPVVCTEVLYLRRIEGLTHQAIADRLGISKSWVEKQLVRTMDHLRKSIDTE